MCVGSKLAGRGHDVGSGGKGKIVVTRTIVMTILKMYRGCPFLCARVDLVKVPLDVAFPAGRVIVQVSLI